MCPFDIIPQSPDTMPVATVGIPYSSDIVASNGTAPYTFSNIHKYTPVFSGIPYDTLLGGLSATYIAPDKLRISGTPLAWQTQVSSQDTPNPNRSIWSQQVMGTDKFTFSARIISSDTCDCQLPHTSLFLANQTPLGAGLQFSIIRIDPDNPGVSVFVVVPGDLTASIGSKGRVWSNTASAGAYNTNDGGSFIVGAGTFYDNINDVTFIQYPSDFGLQASGDGVFWWNNGSSLPNNVPYPLFGIGDSAAYIENLLNTSLRPEWVGKVRFRVFFSDDPQWPMPVIFMEASNDYPCWCTGPYTIQYLVFNAFSQRFSSSSSVGGNQIQFTFDAQDSDGCLVSPVVEEIPLEANCHTILPANSILPNGTVGSPYSVIFTTSGGTAPFSYAVYSGTVPDGTTLNSATGELSGTPTTTGTFTFTIQSTDANGCTCDCKEYTLVVNPAIKKKKRRIGLGYAPMQKCFSRTRDRNKNLIPCADRISYYGFIYILISSDDEKCCYKRQ